MVVPPLRCHLIAEGGQTLSWALVGRGNFPGGNGPSFTWGIISRDSWLLLEMLVDPNRLCRLCV